MKLLRWLPAAALAFSLFFLSATEKTAELRRYRDVRPDSELAEAADWAVGNGLDSPTSETDFSPDWTLTRAELAGYFYRYAYLPEPKYTSGEALNAGEPDRWYYAPLHWCADWGMLRPDTREGFPAETATRNEALVMLYHYAENWERRSVEVRDDHLAGFTDVPQDPDARAAWNWAAANGLLVGAEGSRLFPDRPVTRGQLATLLFRFSGCNDPAQKALRCRSFCGAAPRGWQRLLIETAERAIGAKWEDGSYQLGEDGIPTVIDCSGYVNWMFTASGLHPYDDLECRPLWDSDVSTRVDARGDRETGAQFYARIRGRLKPGDLLLVHRDKNSGFHVMVFIRATKDGAYVLQSLDFQGVDYALFQNDSYYLSNLYGVMRFEP